MTLHQPPGTTPHGIGLYLHIPFCAQKCPYCDFNTYAGLEDRYERYVVALCREIALRAPAVAGRTVTTVFIGGGTPTVLEPAQLGRVLDAARDHLSIAPDAEITSEANPGTVDAARFEGLRAIGVNRLSMGAQSLQPDELAFLGRIHGVADIAAAVAAARAAGFDNINVDFMFGLPGQPVARWRDTLSGALDLGTDHLSLYSLIVEPDTPLHHWVATGTVAAPDDDAAAEQYEAAMALLGGAGFQHYEVSNWARTSAHQSRHNLCYWRNDDYLACGAGAHGHLRTRGTTGIGAGVGTGTGTATDVRWGNHRAVDGYIRRVSEGELPTDFEEHLDSPTAMGETMMVGLRLIDEGVGHARFAALHGVDPRVVYADVLAELVGWGMITVDDERTRVTGRGLMVGNQVFERFVAPPA
ncbi:MAG: radical SAM family heme chaperone HemW [Ardenticatenales bacterium]|nr:radical SAM family heme chaperone HemW [Ardenticatenales bacterium]